MVQVSHSSCMGDGVVLFYFKKRNYNSSQPHHVIVNTRKPALSLQLSFEHQECVTLLLITSAVTVPGLECCRYLFRYLDSTNNYGEHKMCLFELKLSVLRLYLKYLFEH